MYIRNSCSLCPSKLTKNVAKNQKNQNVKLPVIKFTSESNKFELYLKLASLMSSESKIAKIKKRIAKNEQKIRILSKPFIFKDCS